MKLTKKIRWWLFHRLSELGWWICPEPHKSNLQAMMPTWVDIEMATETPREKQG